jgi:hypothetical protein
MALREKPALPFTPDVQILEAAAQKDRTCEACSFFFFRENMGCHHVKRDDIPSKKWTFSAYPAGNPIVLLLRNDSLLEKRPIKVIKPDLFCSLFSPLRGSQWHVRHPLCIGSLSIFLFAMQKARGKNCS